MRIVHISDLHFGMHEAALIPAFLADLESIKPGLIIISGDVTQRATLEQYQLFQAFVKSLPAPAVIVPGNHDIPLHNVLQRLTNPFKLYHQFVSPELEVSFANDQVNVLGVNSVNPYKVKDGRLSHQTLERIHHHFSATSGQLNILFFHHNLNYFSGMHHPLNNADEFLAYLKTSTVHVVCTGHLHYSTIKLIPKDSQGNCAILHAGSLLCQRSKDNLHSFYVMEINNLHCTVDWRVFKNEAFSSQQIDEINFNLE